MADFESRWTEIECEADTDNPIHLGCCGCGQIELSQGQQKRRTMQMVEEKKTMPLPTLNGYAVSGLGLAQRAEQIQLQARARGNAAFSYGEAHRLARMEFSESGADVNQPVFAERTIEAFAEAALPRTRDGRLPITRSGRAQRVQALQAEAAKDGKKLEWREASRIVEQFEKWNGWHPDKPLTFAEAQRQARTIRGE